MPLFRDHVYGALQLSLIPPSEENDWPAKKALLTKVKEGSASEPRFVQCRNLHVQSITASP
jgi:hypothetical protein